MSSLTLPPEAFPKLARWLGERRLTNKAAGERLGIAGETVRRYCLPFGDKERRKPTDDVLERIIDWTDGEVTAADFYPPHLNGRCDSDAEAVAP